MSRTPAEQLVPASTSSDAVSSALATELFSRTGTSAPLALLAIVGVCYPHSGAVAASHLLIWALLLGVPMTASSIFARHALRAIASGADPMRLVNIECIFATMAGAAWGSLPALFSSGTVDVLLFFRLAVLCTAVSFVTSTLSVFLRCWASYVGAICVVAFPWLLVQFETESLHPMLFVGIAVFLIMAAGLALATRRRILLATRDRLDVMRLSETLAAGQADLKQRVREQTSELTRALSALQEKEALLTQAQQVAAVGYFVFDAGTRHFRTSDVFDQTFGIGADEPRTFANWRSSVHPDHRVRVDRLIDELRARGGAAEWTYPFIRRNDAEVRWVRTRSEVELDNKGRISRWFGIVQDITQQRLADSELEQHRHHLERLIVERTAELAAAKEVAETANAAKDAFLANMSHELRTPLNAVIGMAGLATTLCTDPRQRDYLDKIVRSGKHLNRIINDLLDLSKIVAGHMEFETVAFSLRALVQHCNSVMAQRATDKGLALVETIDPAVPDILLGDPYRLQQILLNLIGNAIKFTPTGRVEIQVGLGASTEGRACLDFKVVDSGIGMQPEELERLFKPFSQADATVSRRFGGTGLGLAISRRLAQFMDGDIDVSSEAGRGSVFRVRIWLGIGKAGDLPAAAAPAGDMLPVRYRNAHVLVAEDQPLNREIVEVLLTAADIEVSMAHNGQQALDILARAGPDAFDLVLMDIQMPIMDGLSATRELRRRPGFDKLPVVAMTAHTMAHEKDGGHAAGMNDHIAKPFDNDSFYRTLARWIPLCKQTTAAELADSPTSPALHTRSPGTPKGLDIAGGLERFGGRMDRLVHWLREFVATAGRIPDQIRGEIAGGEAAAAARTAHAFKGKVGMLGMNEIHDVVSSLEKALRNGAAVDELLGALEQSIGRMSSELTGFLDASGPNAASGRPFAQERPQQRAAARKDPAPFLEVREESTAPSPAIDA